LVRVQLQRRLDYIQRQKAREQVMEKLAGTIQWELPEELLVRQARRAINRKIMEMRAQGITEQEILGRQRLLQQDTLRSTAQALKEHFVLQKIAEVEDIDVDEDDLEAEIERYAERTGESPRRVRAKFEKEDLMDALAAEIVERKALDLVLDTAEYTDVPLEEGEQKSLGTIEQQTVPGEMQDPVDAPPPELEAEKKDSTTTTESAPAVPT
jgi:trigger factor